MGKRTDQLAAAIIERLAGAGGLRRTVDPVAIRGLVAEELSARAQERATAKTTAKAKAKADRLFEKLPPHVQKFITEAVPDDPVQRLAAVKNAREMLAPPKPSPEERAAAKAAEKAQYAEDQKRAAADDIVARIQRLKAAGKTIPAAQLEAKSGIVRRSFESPQERLEDRARPAEAARPPVSGRPSANTATERLAMNARPPAPAASGASTPPVPSTAPQTPSTPHLDAVRQLQASGKPLLAARYLQVHEAEIEAERLAIIPGRHPTVRGGI